MMTYDELKQLVMEHRKVVHDAAYLDAQLDHKIFPGPEADRQNYRLLELVKKRQIATQNLLQAIKELVDG
jgi:hypothetical protein